jgi:hypothetical protein
MMTFPVTAGDHIDLVSSRKSRFASCVSSPKGSEIIMALKAANSAVVIARHSASVTTLAYFGSVLDNLCLT